MVKHAVLHTRDNRYELLTVWQYNFSPVDVTCLCALLQTALRGGPLASFLLQSRDKPLHILGMLAGVISMMVIVTVIISTAMFMRNKKSNRILPNRRIKRRPRRQQPWTLKNLFRKPENPGGEFCIADLGPEREPELEVVAVENINYNNNITNVARHWPPPPPPCAPSLPPPPPSYMSGSRQWAVPTVSGQVAVKPKRRLDKNREDHVNAALVSELKIKLEKRRQNQH